MEFAMRACLLSLVLLAVPCAAAEDQPASGQAAEATQVQLQQWIEALGAGRFFDRALATDRLIAVGRPAIEPVAAAVRAGDLEVVVRGIHVLREIALSPDPAAQDAGIIALEQLASDTKSSVGRRAGESLARLAVLRQRRAVEELEQLGAKVYTPDMEIGRQVTGGVLTLEIDEQFKGQTQDLVRLRWLPEVQQAVLEGPHIKDEWLPQLGKMENLTYITIREVPLGDEALATLKEFPRLQQLRILYCPVSDRGIEHLKELKGAIRLTLFGTEITAAGAEQLAKALPTADVDVRQGAFLGIGGGAHPLGFEVATVHPDSAAAQAGLREEDVIVKFAGRKVEDFEGLTAQIGKYRPGDTVQVEFLRGGQKFTKDVQLGAWK